MHFGKDITHEKWFKLFNLKYILAMFVQIIFHFMVWSLNNLVFKVMSQHFVLNPLNKIYKETHDYKHNIVWNNITVEFRYEKDKLMFAYETN